jgi:hypothetical protein
MDQSDPADSLSHPPSEVSYQLIGRDLQQCDTHHPDGV